MTNQQGRWDITDFYTSATVLGDYLSPVRSLSIGLIKSRYDSHNVLPWINLGDRMECYYEGKEIFIGRVWDRQKDNDGTEISYTCKDFGMYLTKNKYSYNFKNITPEEITRQICTAFGVGISTLAKTEKHISRIYKKMSLYDMIISSYNLSNTGKYMCVFHGTKLEVIKKGQQQADDIITGQNLLTSTLSQTLSDMVNRVYVFDENDKLTNTFSNNQDIEAFGLLSDTYSLANGESTDDAKHKLPGVTEKITATNFGNIDYTTGKTVHIVDEYLGFRGLFFY